MKKITVLLISIILLCLLTTYTTDRHPSTTQQVPYKCPTSRIEVDTVFTDTNKSIEIIPNVRQTKSTQTKSKFKFVPGSNSVYRSSQPNLKELRTFLSNHNVSTVIRMNDTEGTGITIKQERELVESMGKHFLWVNAHDGYQKGKGYTESIELVQPFLEHGNVLFNCTAGKDRTGYMVGYYLLNYLGWDKDSVWSYTTDLNEWEKFISEGRKGYIKYMEAFYPYDEWKQKYN